MEASLPINTVLSGFRKCFICVFNTDLVFVRDFVYFYFSYDYVFPILFKYLRIESDIGDMVQTHLIYNFLLFIVKVLLNGSHGIIVIPMIM